MALSFASPVGAVTVAELQNQINALMAQLATLQGGSSVSTTFTTDLTIGSKGDQVSALQQALVSKGFLTMPAGVAYGYFGNLTKSAVAAWQAANGITPAVGYFGPKSRAAFGGAVAGTPGTPSTPATPGSTGITTPGVEGTLSVTSNNSGLVSTAYAGDSKIAILGFNVEAKTSDIAIQRVKLDLGTVTKLYTKGYSKMYVTDGSNVLASMDLNSSTVVKDNSRYFITFTGFSYVVPKDTKKQLVIKADVMSSIDTQDQGDLSILPVSLATDGVRGVDGAGIDQYAGGTNISKTVSFSDSLSDKATLKLSLDSSSPSTSSLVASEGSDNNELDKATVLVFGAKAEKDNAVITDLTITMATTTSASTAAIFPTVYLYDGSTEVDNASYNGSGTVSFHDLTVNVSKDSTKTLTIKVDVRNAGVTTQGLTASVANGGHVTFENSVGDSNPVTPTGSATGNKVSFTKAGISVSLASKNFAKTKSIAFDTDTAAGTATFNLNLKALGSDVYFDTQTASTTFQFQLYKDGVAVTPESASSTVAVNWTRPTGTTAYHGDGFYLTDGQSVTIPVEYVISGVVESFNSGSYSVGLKAVNSANAAATLPSATDFMDGSVEWRTNTIVLP